MPSESTDQEPASAESTLLPCVVLAWLGAVISFLLLPDRAAVRMLFCPSRAGCEAVLSSRYASLLGVPLPWVGAGFYLLLLALLLLAYGSRSAGRPVRIVGGVVWLAVAGLAFSGMLMWVQFAVLHAFCALCTASAVVLALLTIAAFRAERRLGGPATPGSRGVAWAGAALALFATAGFVLPSLAAREDVVATIDGQRFTRAQMEEEIGPALQPLRRDIYTRESAWVRGKLDGVLIAAEARRQQVSAAQLLAAHPAEARPEWLAQLAADHRIDIALKPPPLRNVQLDLSTAQFAGPPTAKVQLVVFSDFQCAHCARLAPVLRRVQEEFPDEVRIAFRYFPLEANPRAVPAAVAAQCAAEQGRFWEYHDKLFAEGGDLSEARLLALADAVGLEREKFQTCRNAGLARKIVAASHADAVQLGLEGAPALFLDGTMIGGYVAPDELVRRIRQRLEAK